jgi:hypothetical protein
MGRHEFGGEGIEKAGVFEGCRRGEDQPRLIVGWTTAGRQ